MIHVVSLLIVLAWGLSLPAGSDSLLKSSGDSSQNSIPDSQPRASLSGYGTLGVGSWRFGVDGAVQQPAADPGGQGVVFLVRHAERADAGMAAAKMAGADPELSDAGKARAAALAAILQDAQITAIFTTEYKRTRDTAQPLAAATGIAAAAIASKDAATLIDRVKASAGNVLVVGHSNTVPDVIKALGVVEPVSMTDDQYDNLFILIRGPRPTLLRLHYR